MFLFRPDESVVRHQHSYVHPQTDFSIRSQASSVRIALIAASISFSVLKICGEMRFPLNTFFGSTLTTILYFLSKTSRKAPLLTESGSLNATRAVVSGPGGGLTI